MNAFACLQTSTNPPHPNCVQLPSSPFTPLLLYFNLLLFKNPQVPTSSHQKPPPFQLSHQIPLRFPSLCRFCIELSTLNFFTSQQKADSFLTGSVFPSQSKIHLSLQKNNSTFCPARSFWEKGEVFLVKLACPVWTSNFSGRGYDSI
jgi:hypothetical protein